MRNMNNTSKTNVIRNSIIAASCDIFRQINKTIILELSGHSMYPCLQHKDQLLVAYGAQSLAEGDIVICQVGIAGQMKASEDQKRWVAHRVVRVEDRSGDVWITTKGDSNWKFDDPCPAADVFGKLISLERRIWKYKLEIEPAKMLISLTAKLSRAHGNLWSQTRQCKNYHRAFMFLKYKVCSIILSVVVWLLNNLSMYQSIVKWITQRTFLKAGEYHEKRSQP
jgi:hypothetical protein